MAIDSDDLALYLSGGSTNTAPASSIGGARSTTKVNETTTLHNIFDKVTGDESNAGDTNYRIVYVRNDHVTLTAENVKIYLTNVYDSGDQGSGNGTNDITHTIIEAVNATAQTLANENTAPTSGSTITWYEGTTRATALDLGDIPPTQARALYLRRIIAQGASAEDTASFTINIEADSAE